MDVGNVKALISKLNDGGRSKIEKIFYLSRELDNYISYGKFHLCDEFISSFSTKEKSINDTIHRILYPVRDNIPSWKDRY